MSSTVATLVNEMDMHTGDITTNRISVANRLNYATEAVIWLQEKLKNDHGLRTYDLSYLDTLHYYLVTTPLADLLDGADLRRRIGHNYQSMTHRSPRELAEEVGQRLTGDDSWAIERRDNDVLLVINAKPRFQAITIDNFDGGVSNWTGDAVNSDISNVSVDYTLFWGGNASLRYDVVVGQSANLRATITSTLLPQNLSTMLLTGVFLLEAYIPQNVNPANITSYTLYFGTNASNYWSSTVTVDVDGNTFEAGDWNTLAFQWSTATQVGTPDLTGSSITYFRIDMNFNSSLTSTTFFHYDQFRVAKPETLTFYYVSWNVGTNASGTTLTAFTNVSYTDIPYFSGKYDQYVKACGHKMAALAFADLRLKEESTEEHSQAELAFQRAFAIFPTSITKEVKSFKVHGINFTQKGHRSGRFFRNTI
jgi:hypothetical protein